MIFEQPSAHLTFYKYYSTNQIIEVMEWNNSQEQLIPKSKPEFVGQ